MDNVSGRRPSQGFQRLFIPQHKVGRGDIEQLEKTELWSHLALSIRRQNITSLLFFDLSLAIWKPEEWSMAMKCRQRFLLFVPQNGKMVQLISHQGIMISNKYWPLWCGWGCQHPGKISFFWLSHNWMIMPVYERPPLIASWPFRILTGVYGNHQGEEDCAENDEWEERPLN